MQCQHCGRDINHPVMVKDGSATLRVGSGCARHFQRTTDTERVREYMRSGATGGVANSESSKANSEAVEAVETIRKPDDYPATATGKTIGAGTIA